jgi:hypothetical protein
MPLSAHDFMNHYRTMWVPLDRNRKVRVDVHQYLINRSTSAHNAEHAKATWHTLSTDIDKQIKEINKHLAAQEWHRQGVGPRQGQSGHAQFHGSRSQVLSPHARADASTAKQARMTRARLLMELDPHVTYGQLGAVPFGKGSPAAVRVYLRLAERYGLASRGLQAFADERKVGLDCSGFVSNYFVARGLMEQAEVMNRGASSFDQTARRRSRLEDVRVGDVMVWSDHSHVAIIDSAPDRVIVKDRVTQHAQAHGRPHGSSNGPVHPGQTAGTHAEYTCVVVESNGHRGLGAETYTLESVDSHGVFHVKRENGSSWQVYINDWHLN